ncbi:FIG00387922: hypothetical protein [hydrothermal vent metagenome]|uniref:RDD domain-containing protein n=1 Tax=hydrothermal vent metagenome TaxID=652676 RepID=A0A1W1D1T9_9ZZZZ
MNNEEIEELLYRENLTLASISSRATAFFLDELLLSILLMIALWDSFTSAQTVEDIILLTNSFVLEYMLMKLIYQAFFVTKYGATLGKIAMKIRVIDVKTLDNPDFLHSLNRSFFRIISEMFFYLGFLWGVFNPTRQTWHDKTAQTLVVNV